MENFISGISAENYYFIRVGEDYEDTEVRGLFWDNPMDMRLAREIVFD